MKNTLPNLKEDETEIFNTTVSFKEMEFRRGDGDGRVGRSSEDITTSITTYKTTISEDKLKTTRTDSTQLQIERKSHIKMGGRSRDVI